MQLLHQLALFGVFPQASDGWLTQDALWLVSKTASDKLRAHLLAQGMDGIPTSNTAVFNVLQDHGIAQATVDGKAIWKATVTSDIGWSHTFTFLKISPAMIWESGERPATFRGTVIVEDDACSRHDEIENARPKSIAVAIEDQRATNPVTPQTSVLSESAIDSALSLLTDELLSTQASPSMRTEHVPTSSAMTCPHPISAPVASDLSDARPEESPGSMFMTWLRDSIQARRLRINDAKALVHTVDGTAFLVSPGVFQRYSQEHPDLARFSHAENRGTWEWAQKQFERLQIHRKQPNGLNIWTCAVSGPRKTRRLHGYLLQEARSLLPDVPFDNPHLKLLSPDATPSLSTPDDSNLTGLAAEQQIEK